jgi:hypothetical protein
MNLRNRTLLLLVIQCLLVSSIAAKYLYERATRPRVWTRAAQYDPELPMRGRYLALSPLVDACSLPRDQESKFPPLENGRNWRVQTVARDGKLAVEDARHVLPKTDLQSVAVSDRVSCDRAPLWPGIDYFVPENARSAFPLKPGQELWVEVTVPPAGPPRAIQLALSDNGKWQPLKFD